MGCLLIFLTLGTLTLGTLTLHNTTQHSHSKDSRIVDATERETLLTLVSSY